MKIKNKKFHLKHNKNYYAFVHIEKAAGTSLIHLLRENFFLKYIDVRPLSNPTNHIFSCEDLETYLRINPFLKCFGGHSVKPYSNLEEFFPNIHYFTILRDPVQRYVSQFQYLVKINRIPNNFKSFLNNSYYHNFQSKKLDKLGDPNAAYEILKDKMINVGLVEEMETFLIRLKMALSPLSFRPYRKIINASKQNKEAIFKIETYKNDIFRNNEKDIWLYQKVKSELLPKLNKTSQIKDLYTSNHFLNNRSSKIKCYMDFLIRKAYYECISGVIRNKNGLSFYGSYN